jgi:hypothetical protein
MADRSSQRALVTAGQTDRLQVAGKSRFPLPGRHETNQPLAAVLSSFGASLNLAAFHGIVYWISDNPFIRYS